MSLPRYTQDEVQALLRQTLSNGCSLHDAILVLQKEHAIPTLDLGKPVATEFVKCKLRMLDLQLFEQPTTMLSVRFIARFDMMLPGSFRGICRTVFVAKVVT